MHASLRRLNALLSRRDRRDLSILLVLAVTGALLEVIGVGAIPAFVTAMVRPETVAELPVIGDWVGDLPTLDPRQMLVWGAVAVVALFGVKNAFLVFNTYWQARFIGNRRIRLSQRLIHAYMHAPYTFHLTRNTAELIRNVDQEANLIANQVIYPLLEITTRALVLVAVLGVLAWAEPLITLGWLVIFGVAGGLAAVVMSNTMKAYGAESQEHRKLVVQALNQGLSSVKESRIRNREGFFAGRVGESIARLATAQRTMQFGGRIVMPVGEFVGVAGLFAIAATLVALGRPTESILVTLALFVVGLVRLKTAVTGIMSQYAAFRFNLPAVDPVHADLMALEAAIARDRAAVAPAARAVSLRRDIRLETVCYTYEQAARPAIAAIDLVIPAGAAVAFVGGTGAGKSTLVDVILGLLRPQEGRVCIDGRDIHAEGALRGWQRAIGYVPQSIYLLDDTLRRNIALGLPDDEIDEDAIRAAVRTAQLEDLVARLPDGLDTMVGERGLRLSGGERQRVGIARALYHDPDVLVLDEATSALDTRTERALIDAVEAQRGRRTIIMIAHRLSTVRNCDTLYLLRDGGIVASGSYDDLLRDSREFSLMATA